MAVVTAGTVMTYALYTFSAPNLPKNHAMMLTIPFVIYGIFRYLYVIHIQGNGGAPDEVLLTDRPLQAAVSPVWIGRRGHPVFIAAGELTAMTPATRRQALFGGLIFDEEGKLAETTHVGDEPNYVILDDGFRRHVPSEYVDRQVLGWLQEQITANKQLVTEGMLAMLGKEDLFTKAMIDASIQHMDQLIEQGIPADARTWLGMFGFRIVVNIHGDVVRIDMPAQETGEEGD